MRHHLPRPQFHPFAPKNHLCQLSLSIILLHYHL
jgi:hypothetical protein